MLTKTLYQISSEYQELFDRLEALAHDPDATPEQMDELIAALSLNEGDLKQKAQAYAAVLRQKEASAEFLSGEIKRLQDLKAREQKQADILRERIAAELQQRGIDKLDGELFRFSFWASEAVVFDGDVDSLPAEFVRVKKEVDKTALKKALKAEDIVPGAKLVTNKSLQIK